MRPTATKSRSVHLASCVDEHLRKQLHTLCWCGTLDNAGTCRWGWRAESTGTDSFDVVAVPRLFDTLLTPTDLKV